MSLAEVIQGVDSFLSGSPINMVKWGSVFVVIIIGYIVLIKSKGVYKKLSLTLLILCSVELILFIVFMILMI